MLRQRRVIFDVSFHGNATPTLVQHSSDAPSAVFLASSGLDDAAVDDAVATGDLGPNFGSLSNSPASVVGVLVDGPKALGGKVDKLFSLDVIELTSVAGTVTSALKGVATSGITTKGNVAFTVSGTALDLTSDTVTYRVTLECQIDQDQTA
jgi:hypothetical protein